MFGGRFPRPARKWHRTRRVLAIGWRGATSLAQTATLGKLFDRAELNKYEKPIGGINTHVKIKYGAEFDFFPEGKVFIEYHPNPYSQRVQGNVANNQYKAQRISILQASEYSDKRVEFIFDSIKNKRESVLEQIRRIQKEYDLKKTDYVFRLRSLRKSEEWND